VGPNARLGDDAHNLTLAARFTCPGNAAYTLQAKVQQGDALGKGSTGVQCQKGETKTVTIATSDADDEFTTGSAKACVGAIKKGGNGAPDPACRNVNVVD
jgi:hypothetical protein